MKQFYWTKARRTQLTYWKWFTGSFLLAVALIGFISTHTDRTLDSLAQAALDIKVTYAREVETPEDMETLIRRIAKEENFQWPDYLVKLFKCESGLNPLTVNAQNNKPSNSRDRGIAQINSYWHYEVTDAQAFDPIFATKWTIKMINEGKQREFICDRYIK